MRPHLGSRGERERAMGQIETSYYAIQYWYPDVIEKLERQKRKSSSAHRNTPLQEWKFVYNWAEWFETENWEQLQSKLLNTLNGVPQPTPSLEERIQQRLSSVMASVEAKPRDRKSRACISYGRPEWQSNPDDKISASPDQLPSPVIAQVVTEEIGKTLDPAEVASWVRTRTPDYVRKHPVKLVSWDRTQEEDDDLERRPEPDSSVRLGRHFGREFTSWFANFQVPSTVLCLHPELTIHIQMLYDRLYELMWSFVTERRNEFIEEWKADEKAAEDDIGRDPYLLPCVAETSFMIKRWVDLLPIGEPERNSITSLLGWKDPSEASRWLCHALLKPEIEAEIESEKKKETYEVV